MWVTGAQVLEPSPLGLPERGLAGSWNQAEARPHSNAVNSSAAAVQAVAHELQMPAPDMSLFFFLKIDLFLGLVRWRSC